MKKCFIFILLVSFMFTQIAFISPTYALASTKINVPNGGFETAFTDSDWGSTITPSAATQKWNQGWTHSGDYQLSHWLDSAYEVDTHQTITGLSEGSYTLSAWTQSGGGQTDSYIMLMDMEGLRLLQISHKRIVGRG